jgi:hypothetical protein
LYGPLCFGIELTTSFILAFDIATFIFLTIFLGNNVEPDFGACFPEAMLLQNEARRETTRPRIPFHGTCCSMWHGSKENQEHV